MARLLGPNMAGWLLAGHYPDRTFQVYTDLACTSLASIATYNSGTPTVPGSVISGSQLRTDTQSQIPLFWFPDGVMTVYAKLSRGGPIVPLAVDPNLRLDVLVAAGITGPVPATGRVPKFLPASTVVTHMQSGNGFTGSAGVNVNDTTDFVMGSQSAKVSSLGAGGTFRINKGGLTLDSTGMMWRVTLKVDDVTHLGSGGVKFETALETGYTNYYQWQIMGAAASSDILTSGEWVTVTLGFQSAVSVGTPTRNNITDVRVTFADDNTGNPLTVHVQSIELIPEPAESILANGLVSITFDDCWQSVWTLAKAKMDAQAVPLRGSIYVISDMVDGTGRLTQAELLTMQDQGWDIAGHAYTDADHALKYTGMTAAALDADLKALKTSLVNFGFRGANGTAYPLGTYGKTTDAVSTTSIVRRYFNYALTTAAGTTRTRETWPPGDLYRLRRLSAISTAAGGYAPSSIIASTTGDLDKCKANKGWMILAFHKIVASGVATTSDILQSDFDAIIDKIVANGMAVLPVGDALRYYG